MLARPSVARSPYAVLVRLIVAESFPISALALGSMSGTPPPVASAIVLTTFIVTELDPFGSAIAFSAGPLCVTTVTFETRAFDEQPLRSIETPAELADVELFDDEAVTQRRYRPSSRSSRAEPCCSRTRKGAAARRSCRHQP